MTINPNIVTQFHRFQQVWEVCLVHSQSSFSVGTLLTHRLMIDDGTAKLAFLIWTSEALSWFFCNFHITHLDICQYQVRLKWKL